MVGPGHVSARSASISTALDKIVKKGRIWRLTYEGMGRRTEQPKMLSETPAQLVAHLSDPNGWWRDTAQQLLVLKQDKSVVPALQKLARSSADQLARIHALWTLEGLGATDAALVAAAHGGQGRADPHPGHPRQRDALQGRRQDARGRLQAPQHRRRHRRRHAVADDDEYAEGAPTPRRRSSRRRRRTRPRACSSSPSTVLNRGDDRGPRRRHLHRSGGAVHAGRAGGARQGARDLHAGVLRLSRRGRQRRTRAGIGERTADWAAARGVLRASPVRRTTWSRCCCTASPARSMAPPIPTR